MRKAFFPLASPLAKIVGVVIFTFFALAPLAPAGERSVTAAEVNGTYRDLESKSEIKILALGHGKLKVQLASRHWSATPKPYGGGSHVRIQTNPPWWVTRHFFLTMQRCNALPVAPELYCEGGTNHVAKPKISSRKPKFDDA